MKTKTTYKTGKAAPSGQAGAAPLALVTGGSSGIGYELADLLAVRGYDLILVGRSLEKLQRAAAALYQNHGSARPALRVETLSFDLSDTSQAQALFNECRRRGWRIDLLINNAGKGVFGPVVEREPDSLAQMLRLNIESLTVLTQLFVAEMMYGAGAGAGAGSLEPHSGRADPIGAAGRSAAHLTPAYILNVGSVAGRLAMPYFAAYSASKHYVREFSLALRQEMRGLYAAEHKRRGERQDRDRQGSSGGPGREAVRPVSVSVLEPGYVRTDFDENAGIENPRYRSFSSQRAMSARRVAEIALKGLFAGKPVIIPGALNRFLVSLTRLSPKTVVSAAVWRVIRKLLS
jgi:hypothetical protein